MNSVFQQVFGYFLCLGFVISLTIFPIFANPDYTQNSNSLPVTTEIRGVWLTNVASGVFYIPWGIERAINQLAALNFNTIYPVVWNRGYTFYKSPLAKKNTGSDSQPLLNGLILEVIKNYNVDGIQIDDHFGMPVQFGYDAFTIQLYQKEHQGKTPPINPFDPEWMRWRANKITAFMDSIFKSVKAIKPYAKISLSPNSQYFAYKYYLQDWENWVKKDLIDELILQVYRREKNSFIQEISKPAIKSAMKKIPVAIGISTGNLLKPVDIDQVKEQVKIVRNQKFAGFSFFYWESLWGYIIPESPYQRRQAFLKMFDTQALRPLKLNKL